MAATTAPNNPFVFGKSSIVIKIGTVETEFADAVIQSSLDMPEAAADFQAVSGKNLSIPINSPSTFTPTFAQDLTTGSLFMYLLANKGVKATVTNKPVSTETANVSFECYLGRPAQFGGTPTAVATTTAQFKLIGDPTFTPKAA